MERFRNQMIPFFYAEYDDKAEAGVKSSNFFFVTAQTQHCRKEYGSYPKSSIEQNYKRNAMTIIKKAWLLYRKALKPEDPDISMWSMMTKPKYVQQAAADLTSPIEKKIFLSGRTKFVFFNSLIRSRIPFPGIQLSSAFVCVKLKPFGG